LSHANRPVYPREIHQGELDRPERSKGIFKKPYPKEQFLTELETWRYLPSQTIEFTMKRLRERIEGRG
jgi:hypothetical protein